MPKCHRSTNRARRTVTSFQPKRVTNLYSTPPTPVPWHHFVSCVAAKKFIKPPICRSKSFKVIEFGANRKPVYDFLLVINSNRPYLAPLLRYSDLLAKNRKFFYPLLFSALVRGDTLRIYLKALRVLKLESSGQPTVKIW